jgi:shikimate dehydrogenase
MHNAALRHDGIAGEYVAFDVPPENLPAAFAYWIAAGVRGMNFTVPHKELVLPLLTEASDAARRIGAANTVAFDGERSRGTNTDGAGFLRARAEAFPGRPEPRSVVVLGAGGAARAVVSALLETGAAVLVANRDAGRADALVRALDADGRGRLTGIGLGADDLAQRVAEADLLVNTTSLGLRANDPSPVPATWLRPGLCVFDTVYGDHMTALVRDARVAGAAACDGLGMLVHQGALAYEFWHGRPAPLAVMKAAAGCS